MNSIFMVPTPEALIVLACSLRLFSHVSTCDFVPQKWLDVVDDAPSTLYVMTQVEHISPKTLSTLKRSSSWQEISRKHDTANKYMIRFMLIPINRYRILGEQP